MTPKFTLPKERWSANTLLEFIDSVIRKIGGTMAALVKHIKTDTWAYYSLSWKVSPNTFVTNSERKLYVGGPGVKAAFKIAGVPVGTRVTVDMEEYNEELGYHRIFKFPDIATLVPAEVTAFLKEKYPEQSEWQLWIDRSGLSEWTDPVVEPDPIVPEPEPDPVPGVVRKFLITVEEILSK